MQNISDAKKLYTETLANCMESQENWLAFLDFAAKFQMPQSLQQHGFSTQLAVYGSPHRSDVCLTEDDWAVYDRYVLSDHDSIPVLGTDFSGNTLAVSLIPQECTADFDESAPTPLPNFTLDFYAAQVQSAIASKHDMPTDISLAETLREVIYHELSELPMTQKAAEFAQNTMLYQLCSRYGIEPDKTLDFSYLDEKPSMIDIARIGQNINTVLFSLEQSIENAIAIERSYENEPRREARSMETGAGDAASEQSISGGFVSGGTGGAENVHGVRDVGYDTHTMGTVPSERPRYSGGDTGVQSSGGGLGTPERRTGLEGASDGLERNLRESEIQLSQGTETGAVSGNERSESASETLQRAGENHQSESGFAGGTLETDGRSVSESSGDERLRAAGGTVEQLHRFGGGIGTAGDDIRIIGNTAIQDIPEKRMTYIDAEIAIQVAEKLESLSVSYACSIQNGSDMATLYVPKQDIARCCRVIADAMDAASEIDTGVEDNSLSLQSVSEAVQQPETTAENVLPVAQIEATETAAAWDDKDRIFYDTERKELTWVYYNPDSLAGGQLVIDTFDTDLLEAAMFGDNPLDYIHAECKQTLCDIDASDFAETVNYYMEKEAQCVTDADDTAAQLSYFRELNEKLLAEKAQQENVLPVAHSDCSYEIYQLRDTDAASRLKFLGHEELSKYGAAVQHENYAKVYGGTLDAIDNENKVLNQLYETFNLHHPEDFKGHSLSVSDIIVLTKDGNQTAYYTDSFGFKEVPEFLRSLEEKQTVSENEILREIALKGSGFDCGKYRIAKFYQENQPTNAEFAAMLKDEYGIGGSSSNDERIRFVDYDSKGIRVQLSADSEMQFSWNKVAKEIETLLEQNSYLTQQEIDDFISSGKEEMLDPDAEDLVRNRAAEMLTYFGIENYPVSVPFYEKTVGEAKELGEITQYRENVAISKSCIEFITKKMPEYYAQGDLDGFINELSERYGIDRALNTLAYTVQHAEWDARYTDEVKEYARQYAIPETFGCHCSVHPVKLNGLYLKLMTAKEQQIMQRLHGFAPSASEIVLPVAQPQDELITEIKPAEVQTKAKNSYENRAYRLLEEIAPDILHDADLNYLRMESESFEPLVIERIGDDQISIAHYYEQNGDLMRDPEVVMRVDAEHKALYPLEFLQDNPPLYQRFDSFNAECRDVLQFCVNDWFPNIQNQNQPLIRAVYDYAGEEVTLHYRPDGTIKSAEASSDVVKNAFLQSRSFDVTEEKHNFRLTEGNVGIGSVRERCHNNIAAIRVLKQIESEGRMATEEEQKILAKYVGWGGLQDALDPRQSSWQKEYDEIRSLLTEKEYATASRSVLTAFYTPPVVINAIYDKLQDMGFHGGRVLEPSMGIGNFYGCMPQSMQEQSELHGVELDEISGRIARQLYQTADVEIMPYQNTKFQNGSFDVIISNVPFDTLKVKDKEIGNSFMLHDYFFAKSLEKVKEGGIIAFITSTGTMDKQNPAVRKYLAERADLLGAVRLPSGTFGASAGTKVDADIIFLKKRSQPLEIEPDWVQSRQEKDINGREYRMNSYFLEHPEMYLGNMGYNNRFGDENASTVCMPDGRDLEEMLQEAFQHISGEISQEPAAVIEKIADDASKAIRPAPLDMAEGSLDVIDGKLFKRMGEFIESTNMPRGKTVPMRIQGMKQIADITQHILEIQQKPETTDDMIIQAQAQLRSAYENFVSKFGALNSRENERIFAADSRSPLLHTLEIIKNGKVTALADIFTKRTIIPHTAPTQADSAVEALGFSISEKAAVDIDYMMQLTGKSQAEIVSDLRGIIFQNPKTGKYEMQDEYLSGNIRVKLEEAKEAAKINSSYQLNVDALEKAMPERLDASDIQVRLGATWIPVKYYEQFMKETFHLQNWQVGTRGKHITFCPQTAEWSVSGNISVSNVQVNEVFGTQRRDAFSIFEDCLNLKSTEVHDTIIEAGGKRRSVKNVEETEAAQRCQDMLQEEFVNWIFEDPNRRYELVDIYNEKYNSTVPRQYDGSHLIFPNMNPAIVMKEHQRGAIAHAIYGDNTLFAHEVGAGKTFEMIASIMEGKRLGRHQKSLMCVPNHLTEQTASDFLKLYPAANILVATSEDFSAQNRKRFCARVATGNYDAVIMGHSHLRHIPLSHDRQVKYYQQEIDDARQALLLAPDRESRKMIERQVQRLEEKLTKLLAIDHDDAVTFEQMGIDQIVLDEAHEFKNLFLITKMSNVSGISTNDNVEKTVDLYMKCKYMDELEHGQTIFATATPVSNSVTEIYTMMRYLQADTLKDMGMGLFDAWASTFGKTVTDLQLAPEGKGYRAKTRFAEFYNLPELMRVFKECADIKVADELNLNVPECETHIVAAEPTKIQLDMIEQLSQRAEAVHNHTVDSSVDNMLVITSDGKKIGLDQRAIDTALPDNPHSKVNLCIDNVYKIWDETTEQKATQIIFCDMCTPSATKAKAASSDGEASGNDMDISDSALSQSKFNVYEDIRQKLIAKGVPAEQIAFIHDAKTELQKEALYQKMRDGDVRVLLGSTKKMGTGMNVQDRLIASHDLDAPWRPADMTQRLGRMVRQGNMHKQVHLYRYVTEKTFDSYLYQTLENKAKYIAQIMTSKSPMRSCEDMDISALNYAEIKTLCAGDPRIQEKMQLDIDVAKLRSAKNAFLRAQNSIEDKALKILPTEIAETEQHIAGVKADIQKRDSYEPQLDENFEPVFSVRIGDTVYNDKEKAGEALRVVCTKALEHGAVPKDPIAEYQGFKLYVAFDILEKKYKGTLKGTVGHSFVFGESLVGNFTRMDNALLNMENKLGNLEHRLKEETTALNDAKKLLDRKFPNDEELRVKTARLSQLNRELTLDPNNTRSNSVQSEEEERIVLPVAQPLQIPQEDSFFRKISEQELAKLKASNSILFESRRTPDGEIIVRCNKLDKEKLQQVITENSRKLSH